MLGPLSNVSNTPVPPHAKFIPNCSFDFFTNFLLSYAIGELIPENEAVHYAKKKKKKEGQ